MKLLLLILLFAGCSFPPTREDRVQGKIESLEAIRDHIRNLERIDPDNPLAVFRDDRTLERK